MAETKPNTKSAETKPKSGIASFSFQFIEPRCRAVIVKSVKGSIGVRSKWSLSILNRYGSSGDVGSHMQRMPDVPGLTISVMPKELKVKVTDPLALAKNKNLLDQINSVVSEASAVSGAKFGPVPDAEYSLNEDEMVTLMKELQYYNQAKSDVMELDILIGSFPTEAQIEKMAGHSLFDIRSNSRIQPKYEHEYDQWQYNLVFNAQKP